MRNKDVPVCLLRFGEIPSLSNDAVAFQIDGRNLSVLYVEIDVANGLKWIELAGCILQRDLNGGSVLRVLSHDVFEKSRFDHPATNDDECFETGDVVWLRVLPVG